MMAFYTKCWEVNGRRIAGASLSHGRLAAVDLDRMEVLWATQVSESLYESFDISWSSGRVAVGHASRRTISIFSALDGAFVRDVPAATAVRVMFDANGDHIATWGYKEGKHVYSLNAPIRKALRNGGDLDGALLIERTNELYVPTDRAHVLHVRFSPLHIEAEKLRHDCPVYSMTQSPTDSRIVCQHHDGRIECRDGLKGDLLWSRQHEDKAQTALGSFSGDGRFFALNVVNLEQYWILNAFTGELTFASDKPKGGLDPRSPLNGTLILASGGEILDAETGQVSEGISSPAWWKRAGL